MIFFSDLDGTFLTSTKAIHPRCQEALDELARRGLTFVPCTGRPVSGIVSDILNHPAVRFAVAANGATVYELDPHDPSPEAARCLHATPLAREKALAVLDIARAHDVTFDVFADGECFLRRDLFDRIPEFASDPHVVRSMQQTRTAVDEDAADTIRRVHLLERVSMYWHDPRDRDEILAALREVPGIDIARSYPMNIEVMDERASKGSALTWLCGHLGIPVSDAMSFGDNINDIPMIQAAGTGVAMANAEPEVQEAADLICGSNDEGAVGEVILSRLTS